MRDLNDIEMKELKDAAKAALGYFEGSIQSLLRAHMTALRLQGYDETVCYDLGREYTANDLGGRAPHWLRVVEAR